MIERLNHRRISFDLQHLNQMLHDFLMMLAPKPAQPDAQTAIDWEDGESPDQTEPPVRR